jgi:predicted hydrocarbon binding protein
MDILKKLIGFNALNWSDGKFTINKMSGIIHLLYVNVYQQRLLEQQFGKKGAMEHLYSLGIFQGRQGFKIISERFGYKKKLDKKKLLEFNSKQSEFVGLGKCKWIKIDFVNNIFILRMQSAMAKEYRRLFGLQKEPIDHLIRGITAAFIEELTGNKVLSIETRCIAKGDKLCEFVVKPIHNWNKNYVLSTEQNVDEINLKEELKLDHSLFLFKR